MLKNFSGIIISALTLGLCLSAPLAVSAADAQNPDSSSSAMAKTGDMMKGYDMMMQGAKILTGRTFRMESDGTDKTVEKRKGKIREAVKLITDGQAMIQSSARDDEASKKMLQGVDMMATGAGMMLKSPTMMDVFTDGQKMVIDGRKIMVKAKKKM